MKVNNIFVIVLGILSFVLIKDFANKYIVGLILATTLVGMCITKNIVMSVSFGLISGSLYTLFLQQRPIKFEEFKIRKQLNID